MYFSTNLKNWESHTVVQLDMSQLWASVPAVPDKRPEFYKTLKQDIEKNGLKNPIITVKSTVGGAWIQKKKYRKQLCEPPGHEDPKRSNPRHNKELYVIWGGSNRYAILKELGCTKVDCIVLDDFQVAFKVQATQRNSYPNLHRLK
jgi:ParB-like chromosome segregation protein Spo0J